MAITLTISPVDPDEKHVRLSDFLAELSAVRKSLKRTGRHVPGGQAVDWQVSDLRHSSPAMVELEPVNQPDADPESGAAVITKFIEFQNTLLEGHPHAALDRTDLRAFKEMNSETRHARIKTVIANGSSETKAAAEAFGVVGRILEAPSETSFGSIRGRLEEINIHGSKQFRIWPRVGPTNVVCKFSRELQPHVQEALERNVVVHGKTRRHQRDQFIYLIEATQIEVLPLDDELPTLWDLRGADPEIGAPLAEW